MLCSSHSQQSPTRAHRNLFCMCDTFPAKTWVTFNLYFIILTFGVKAWGDFCSPGFCQSGQTGAAWGRPSRTPSPLAARSWWGRPRCLGLAWRRIAVPPGCGWRLARSASWSAAVQTGSGPSQCWQEPGEEGIGEVRMETGGNGNHIGNTCEGREKRRQWKSRRWKKEKEIKKKLHLEEINLAVIWQQI